MLILERLCLKGSYTEYKVIKFYTRKCHLFECFRLGSLLIRGVENLNTY